MSHPIIIQGGMGVGVSNWRLARTVSRLGQLGVVSGTLLGVVLARRLQMGDPDGHIVRALEHFPIPSVVERLMRDYFVPGGKSADKPFKAVPMPAIRPSRSWLDLTIAGSFVEVFLAREGHANPVGVNCLEKVQVATLASRYGAMLAGVGYVLMGAGIPRHIPGTLDRFAAGKAAGLKIDIDGTAAAGAEISRFDPSEWFDGLAPVLNRPFFLPIVSSAALGTTLARKSNGRVDGFIIEGFTAGGHNAPPRGPMQLDASGQPIYGVRDVPELGKFRDLGLPFWLAGSCVGPGKLAQARAAGAQGVQVGTAFAYCEESGIDPKIKRQVCRQARDGIAKVTTDPRASPTSFPFKVLEMDATLSQEGVYKARKRVCDLGYLRQAYAKPDGTVGYRCASEPAEAFLRKDGDPGDLVGRKCLCNGLLATVGLGQVRSSGVAELPIITSGDDINSLARFMPEGEESYHAADVVAALLADVLEPATV